VIVNLERRNNALSINSGRTQTVVAYARNPTHSVQKRNNSTRRNANANVKKLKPVRSVVNGRKQIAHVDMKNGKLVSVVAIEDGEVEHVMVTYLTSVI
jgi:hypothetical protein